MSPLGGSMGSSIPDTCPIGLEDDDDEESIQCVGRRCFRRPHEAYVLPSFYPIPLLRGEKVPGRDFRWKVSLQLREGNEWSTRRRISPRLGVLRGFSLPQLLGLGDNGRWRWQGVPFCLLVGGKLDLGFGKQSEGGLSLRPALRLKVLTPVFGILALRPALELLPNPTLTVKRLFSLGSNKLSVRASLEARKSNSHPLLPNWSLQLHWHPADSLQVQRLPKDEGVQLTYSRSLPVTRDCKVEIDVGLDVPASKQEGGLAAQFLHNLRLQRIKISQIIGTLGRRNPPKRTSTYLKASKAIGKTGVITVVPGHWIDPGFEPGAPGEREFNLEVANAVEQQLRTTGWEVLRPDRDAPSLRWEEYLNWVSRQTLRGSPVLEIHGQGSAADYRGFVLGVIGDQDASLNKELAQHFGVFPMCWRELGVPRRGGVLLECFNSDEVCQMAPWHRTWAVGQLAGKITECIERASAVNRGGSPEKETREEKKEPPCETEVRDWKGRQGFKWITRLHQGPKWTFPGSAGSWGKDQTPLRYLMGGEK